MDVAYCRSSDWQKGKVALRSQKNESIHEAKKIGVEIPEENFLFEKGKSGRSLERPKMQQLLEWIKSGKLDHGHLFISSYDRLTRNLSDLTYLLELFELHDVHVHSAKEKIPDDMTPSVRTFYIHSLGVISQNYLETCRNHAFVAAERRRKEGKPLGSAPYGYEYAEGGFELNPKDGDTIGLIFKLYISGLGYKKICKELTKRGKSIYGRSFKETDIYRILGNITYAGMLGKGENIYKGKHQAVVSLADFELVQQLRKGKQRGKVYELDYPLRRKIICFCGWHVSCHTYSSKKGRLKRYYSCANPIHRDNGYSFKLPAETIENQLLTRVRRFLANQSFLKQLLQHVKQEQKQQQQSETKRLKRVKKRKEQLFSAYENKLINLSDFSEQLKQLRREEMKPKQKQSAVTTEKLATLILTEEKVKDCFLFDLVQRVELSASNEMVGLYLKQLPDYNLLQGGDGNEATNHVS
ncbi:recombinase family protein [Enterococcus raffinosus]|uniref:recombinase family protein n=1 Tax=Enterococcus raffinosus TaxID=71452 RepID=UPI001C101D5A|nr:recombinase family protein [Enterococcus raffinosus]MBU5363392.1 recombinase family protein [Enterococcus raffinosus]